MSVPSEEGKKPKLAPVIEGHLVAEFNSGEITVGELASRYSVGVATVYRAVDRAKKRGSGAAVAMLRVEDS